MSLFKKVAYNSIVQIGSKFIATVLGLVAVALITRYLGQAGFGEYTTVITFLSFFGIIIDFGLTLVTAQMLARPGANKDNILSNLFSLRLVTAIIFLGIGPWVVFLFPYSLAVKIGVVVTTLAFFFNALNQIFIGLFQKELSMDKVAIAEIAGRLFLVIGVIGAVYFNFGLIGILTATVISSAVNFFLHCLFSLKYARIKFVYDRYCWGEIIKRAWPISLTIVFNLIYLKSDTLILSLIKTPAEVGIYGAAYKVIDVLVTIPFMFSGLILPIITNTWAQGDYSGFKNVVQKSFDVLAIICLPIIIGTQFVAEKVMVLVAGADFYSSGQALRILILAAAAIFFGSIFTHAIVALDKQKKIISAYVFTSFTALAAYLIFIPKYSYIGAAWTTVYSEVIIALASFILIWKQTKFSLNPAIFLKSLLASLLMGAILYIFKSAGIFILLFLGALSYLIVLYLLKGLDLFSIKELLNLKSKAD